MPVSYQVEGMRAIQNPNPYIEIRNEFGSFRFLIIGDCLKFRISRFQFVTF